MESRFSLHLGRVHLWLVLAVLSGYVVFAFLVLQRVCSQGAGGEYGYASRIVRTTASTLLGPFVAHVENEWPFECAAPSTAITTFACFLLLAGLFAQSIRTTAGAGWSRWQLAAWTLGWTTWFLSGLLLLIARLG